jgi:hypothetical protein
MKKDKVGFNFTIFINSCHEVEVNYPPTTAYTKKCFIYILLLRARPLGRMGSPSSVCIVLYTSVDNLLCSPLSVCITLYTPQTTSTEEVREQWGTWDDLFCFTKSFFSALFCSESSSSDAESRAEREGTFFQKMEARGWPKRYTHNFSNYQVTSSSVVYEVGLGHWPPWHYFIVGTFC